MSKRMARSVAVVLGIALLALVQGCGGGSDSGSTKAEFVKQARAICNKAEQEREELTEQLILEYQEREENATQKQQEEAALKIVKVYEKTTAALADLDLPAGEEQKVEAILEAREDAASQVEASPSTALHNGAPFRKPDELGKAYGMTACSV